MLNYRLSHHLAQSEMKEKVIRQCLDHFVMLFFVQAKKITPEEGIDDIEDLLTDSSLIREEVIEDKEEVIQRLKQKDDNSSDHVFTDITRVDSFVPFKHAIHVRT